MAGLSASQLGCSTAVMQPLLLIMFNSLYDPCMITGCLVLICSIRNLAHGFLGIITCTACACASQGGCAVTKQSHRSSIISQPAPKLCNIPFTSVDTTQDTRRWLVTDQQLQAHCMAAKLSHDCELLQVHKSFQHSYLVQTPQSHCTRQTQAKPEIPILSCVAPIKAGQSRQVVSTATQSSILHPAALSPLPQLQAASVLHAESWRLLWPSGINPCLSGSSGRCPASPAVCQRE